MEAGAVLAQIDPKDYQVELEHARAELADAQATAEAAQVGVPIMSISTTSQLRAARAEVANALAGVAAAERQSAIAEAKLREAEANHSIAEEDLRRYERLLAKDAATRQQYDQALAQAKASAAAAVMLPAFMEILDTTVAAVSLPHIASNLAATAEESTWVLTSYLISNAIVLPASGWPSTSAASDFSSPVSPFLPRPRVCAGAWISLCMIIVARIFQGLGGGALQPISQAILLESFPTYRRGTAMAVLGLGVVFAPVIGPTWADGSRTIFLAVDLLHQHSGCLLVILMIRAVVEDPPYIRTARPGRIDTTGFGLMAVWLATLQVVLDKGQQEDCSPRCGSAGSPLSRRLQCSPSSCGSCARRSRS